MKRSSLPIIAIVVSLGVALCVILATSFKGAKLFQAESGKTSSGSTVNPLDSTVTRFNPDALKGWEVMKTDQGEDIGNARTGFGSAARKRMREFVALELKGGFNSPNPLKVELRGEEHQQLVFIFSGMNAEIANGLPKVFQDNDPDFWNRIRIAAFSEVVFTGDNYYKAIPQTEYVQWSHDYEAFLSNMVERIRSDKNQSQIAKNDNSGLSPDAKKNLRLALVSAIQGGLKIQNNPIGVEIGGDNDDKLVYRLSEMNAEIASNILTESQRGSNFWNGLRFAGFSEVVFAGNNYHRSIPRSEFVQWCRNYERYVAEYRKYAEQMKSATQRESQSP